mmetsp:Transcript_14405/g.25798  ORF Transcript_14405/g.25798 Transcript_14405/m.25798 type:complete len:238 (-) Transcript_14405:243-956(-)
MGSEDFLGAEEMVAVDAASRSIGGTMDAGSTVSLAEQERRAAADESVVGMFKRSSHPVAAVFHVAFKIAALVLYLFGSAFQSYVVIFVLCVICLAFDFWTVKNITGRLMVGLRWWSDIGEDDSNVWRYESIENIDDIRPVDYRIFWYSQYINIVVWILLGFLDLLKLNFDWLLLVIVAVGLAGSNIYGYWQCSKDARNRLEGAIKGAVHQQAMNALSGSFSSIFSRAQPTAQTAPSL